MRHAAMFGDLQSYSSYSQFGTNLALFQYATEKILQGLDRNN